jgi:uncharacterized protein (TIRG00374 family)
MFVGWGISVAAIAYVLSRLQFSELRKDVVGISWWMIGVAIVVEILPRLLESVRWQYLLKPVKVGLGQLFEAVYVGTLYSGILPFSGGDVVRAVIVARRAKASLTIVLSTELIERVADAIAIVLVVWLTLQGLTLPYALRIALAAMEVGVGVAVAAGLLLAVRQKNLRNLLNQWRPSLGLVVRLKSIGLDLIEAAGRVRLGKMLVAIGAALAAAVVNVTAYWLILHAYHIDLSPLHAAALFAIVMIGTFLPGTPGNVGSWQFFCVVGLQLFGVSAARAAGYSLVAFAVWTVPPILMGLGALLASPITWSDLRARHSRVRDRSLET